MEMTALLNVWLCVSNVARQMCAFRSVTDGFSSLL